MKLIIGLGNPGKGYQKTRHNIGFMVIDHLADELNIDIDHENFHSIYGKGKFYDEDIIIMKPLTFMNLSGLAVREVADFYKVPLEDIIVIYDELALPPGKLRLREKGSSGGHKGMKDIIAHLNSEEIKRLRIGIGEPLFDTVDYVLGTPTKEEKILIDQAIEQAIEAIKVVIKEDFHHAMSKFN